MPVTVSHPAAVLPLIRLGLVPSALVIGSMAPDTPYFLPVVVSAATTHSLLGTLTADVLLGGALVLLWHGLLARFVLVMAPGPVRVRIDPGRVRLGRPVTARGTALVALSLAIGSATHVFWDAFTHPDGQGTRHIGWLAAQHAGLPGYKWAQYASGLLGAAAIGGWLLRWWRATPAVQRKGLDATVTATVSVLLAAGGLGGALIAALPALDAERAQRIIFLAGTGAAGGVLVAAVLCAGWLRIRQR